MSAAALLESLSRDGVSVECVADRLKIHAPRDLEPRVLDAIRCHKSELLELLQLESAARTASTRNEPQAVAPPLPPSLVGIPGIEYSTERGEWIRRIGDGVWRVPLAKEQPLPAYIDDFTSPRAFLRAVRAVKVPLSLQLTQSEEREYRHAVACLKCDIDPRDVCANVVSLNSIATVLPVKSEKEIEEC